MRAGALEAAGLADVGGFVKAGFELNKRGDRFTVFGGFAQRLDDGRVAGGPVKRLFDRHDVRVAGGLTQETHDHVESLVGMMQQHIFLLDRGEHVAVVVLHAFGHARRKAGPEQVGAVIGHKLFEIGNANHAVNLDHFINGQVQFLHDERSAMKRSICAGTGSSARKGRLSLARSSCSARA